MFIIPPTPLSLPNTFTSTKLTNTSWKEIDHTLIDSINVKLRKHNDVVSMTSTICDPVFLCHGVWSIDDKFLGFLVICRCCFHLHCIVTIAKFCQTKASHILKRVNTLGLIKKQPFKSKFYNLPWNANTLHYVTIYMYLLSAFSHYIYFFQALISQLHKFSGFSLET